ncbi:MAG: hypothetical protein H6587_03600 [Flavobacteriales bacterium]|nr:hypothetical protein [Flavobacteriales bacterium]MCB9363634.1 hypothetical protein [Flavobacteriales bacterium]
MKHESINKKLSFRKTLIGGTLSINDLRDIEFKGEELSPQERLALKNFDRHRIFVLNNQKNEKEFHVAYTKLQVLANLSPYDEFLKEEYFI